MNKPWHWVALGLIVLSGCNPQEENMTTAPRPINWSALSGKHIVFAHQSVGANILSGVEELARRDGVTLMVNEQRDGPAGTGITHFNVGRNEDPLGKIRDFTTAIEAGAARGADVALMKLCYIDFNTETDAREVAEAYIGSLDTLSQKFPDTRFVAVTAPLAAVQTGPKALMKRLLGRQPAQYIENAKRAEFNQLVRARYSPGNQLFDLARLESEGGGARTVVNISGHDIESLDPMLTDDGGHLNERGQQLAAAEFLNFLGGIPPK
jgi:hypothetical protein